MVVPRGCKLALIYRAPYLRPQPPPPVFTLPSNTTQNHYKIINLLSTCSARLLVLIRFFYLTLAVPNPANGVFSRDPAAAVDLFSKVDKIPGLIAPTDTPELAIIRTEIRSLAESTDAIVPRNHDRPGRCRSIDDQSPLSADIWVAVDYLRSRGQSPCIKTTDKKNVSVTVADMRTVRITAIRGVSDKEISCVEVANLALVVAGDCLSKDGTKSGGWRYQPHDGNLEVQDWSVSVWHRE